MFTFARLTMPGSARVGDRRRSRGLYYDIVYSCIRLYPPPHYVRVRNSITRGRTLVFILLDSGTSKVKSH